MRYITIDPGFNTGYAIWDYDGKKDSLTSFGLITLDDYKSDSKIKKTMRMGNHITKMIYKNKPDLVIIEGIEFRSSSLKSNIAFSRGDTIYLSYIIGYALGICKLKSINFKIVNPSEWKGQMNDAIVIERVKLNTGVEWYNKNILEVYKKTKSAHVAMALGIGFDYRGKL